MWTKLGLFWIFIVKKEGKSVRVYVTGSDLLDGTPIVDIKPYIHYSDAVIDAVSGYAQDEPNRKSVIWSDRSMAWVGRRAILDFIAAQERAEVPLLAGAGGISALAGKAEQ